MEETQTLEDQKLVQVIISQLADFRHNTINQRCNQGL